MTLELIDKIVNKSKSLHFQASKNYKAHSQSFMPYEKIVAVSDKFPNNLFLIHKNMIFGRNSITDSSYDVWKFEMDGKSKKEEVDKLGREFFRSLKVIKTI